MANSFNTFKVLSPNYKDTFAPKKLKPAKLPKPPKIPGAVKAPKIGGY